MNAAKEGTVREERASVNAEAPIAGAAPDAEASMFRLKSPTPGGGPPLCEAIRTQIELAKQQRDESERKAASAKAVFNSLSDVTIA